MRPCMTSISPLFTCAFGETVQRIVDVLGGTVEHLIPQVHDAYAIDALGLDLGEIGGAVEREALVVDEILGGTGIAIGY